MISAADFDLLTGCGSDVRRPSGDQATGRRTGGELVGARGFEPPTSRSRTVRATRLRYAPTRRAHCTGSSRLPGVLSDELHELALATRARLHFTPDLLHDGQRLVLGVPDGHHHASTLGELLEERRGDPGAPAPGQHPLERRFLGPAHPAPAAAHPHVVAP